MSSDIYFPPSPEAEISIEAHFLSPCIIQPYTVDIYKI